MRRLLVTASLVALGISFGGEGPASAMVNPLRSGTPASSTGGMSPLTADVVVTTPGRRPSPSVSRSASR